uniref:Coatomer subunit gamma C-terminal domain-containing protein n=1 Tax=Timema bartmani TaxID=61472 RepID=A0A7R9F365_9NEOP|nr:unnamed protein product [Timema bartmani]
MYNAPQGALSVTRDTVLSQLEDVEVTLGDQIQKVSKANFGAAWEEAANYHELEDTYALSSMGSLEEAVKSIISFLGMQPVERSDKVMEGKSSHTLYLAGLFRGGHDVLLRAKLALGDGVTMQLTVRSTDPDIAELVTSAQNMLSMSSICHTVTYHVIVNMSHTMSLRGSVVSSISSTGSSRASIGPLVSTSTIRLFSVGDSEPNISVSIVSNAAMSNSAATCCTIAALT